MIRKLCTDPHTGCCPRKMQMHNINQKQHFGDEQAQAAAILALQYYSY